MQTLSRKQCNLSKHTLINPNKNKAKEKPNNMNHIASDRFELLTSLTND